jgi:lipopolysaccharide export system permease protein
MTIDRYVLRELAPRFVLALTLFTFVAVIDKTYQLTGLVITRGVPLAQVLTLLGLMVPSLFTVTLPFALLVAIGLAGARLTADGEMIAFQAAGIGPLRLLRPVLIATAVVGATVAAITTIVNPWTYGAVREQLLMILRTRAESGLEERVFNAVFDNVVLYAEELDPRRRTLRKLLVSDERRPGPPRILVAREARFLDAEPGRVTLRLTRGVLSDADPAPHVRASLASFEVCDITVSMTAPDGLMESLRQRPRELALPGLAGRARAREDERVATVGGARAARVEIHKRFALPFVALAFAVTGYPVTLQLSRRRRATVMASLLAIAVTYAVMFGSLEAAASGGSVPPWMVWLPNAVFLLAGAVLLWLECRQSGVRLHRLARRPGRLVALARSRLQVMTTRRVHARLANRCLGPAGVREWRRFRTFRTMDRYIVREYLRCIGAGVAVLAALVFLLEFAHVLDDLVTVRPPHATVVLYLVLRVVAGCFDALPVAVVIGTVVLFTALRRHRELDAFQAAGISLHRVCLPAIAVVVVLAASALLFQETVLPRVTGAADGLGVRTRRHHQQQELVRQDDRWQRASETMFRKMGAVDVEIESTFHVIRRLDHLPGRLADRGTVRLASEEPRASTTAMTLRELRRHIAASETRGGDVRRLRIALHSRLACPFVHVALALLAIPLAVRHQSRLAVGVLIAAIVVAYWVAHGIAIAAATVDLLPPALGAWTANILFAGAGGAASARMRL